jgi:hypothetical protein
MSSRLNSAGYIEDRLGICWLVSPGLWHPAAAAAAGDPLLAPSSPGTFATAPTTPANILNNRRRSCSHCKTVMRPRPLTDNNATSGMEPRGNKVPSHHSLTSGRAYLPSRSITESQLLQKRSLV